MRKNMIKRTLMLFILLSAVITPIYAEEKTGIKHSAEIGTKIKITINRTVLTATLYNNETTKTFISKLPLTLPMVNLYSREMVYRFPYPLPAEEVSYRGYKVGEIIYYPPRHSFVIMYSQNNEKFSMQSMGMIESDVRIISDIKEANALIELIK